MDITIHLMNLAPKILVGQQVSEIADLLGKLLHESLPFSPGTRLFLDTVPWQGAVAPRDVVVYLMNNQPLSNSIIFRKSGTLRSTTDTGATMLDNSTPGAMISEVYADRFRLGPPPSWAPRGTVSLAGEFGDIANACWHEILHNKVNADPSKPFLFHGKVIRDTHDPAQGGGGLAIGGNFGRPPHGFDVRNLTSVNKQLMGAALTRLIPQYVDDLPAVDKTSKEMQRTAVSHPVP